MRSDRGAMDGKRPDSFVAERMVSAATGSAWAASVRSDGLLSHEDLDISPGCRDLGELGARGSVRYSSALNAWRADRSG
jgi:hypothetical protein